MILIGAYPTQLRVGTEAQGIAALGRFLDHSFGPGPALHLLPFFPSAGDFGFAPNDLLVVEESLGSWGDIQEIARKRSVLIDGIFNHVGRGHEWVRAFHRDPASLADTIVAYRDVRPSEGPNSPRGDPVLRPTQTSDGLWHVWQTFTEYAIDVHLGSDRARKYFESFLALASESGVWGIRLDAVAYYAKQLGGGIRHNSGVHELAASIAELVHARGLRTMAQLDCDTDGLRYFSEERHRSIPINDFSFAVHLFLALAEQRPLQLAEYINQTASIDRILVRAPRTHDGILLRSGNFPQSDKNRIIADAERRGITVRRTDGDPYELNCSGTRYLQLIVGDDHVNAAIEMTSVVTIFSSDIAYFYLPYIVGHIPEESGQDRSDVDPRAVNRTPIPMDFLTRQATIEHIARLRRLFEILSGFRSNIGGRRELFATASNKALRLHCQSSGLTLVANLSNEVLESELDVNQIIVASRFDGSELGPYGYLVVRQAVSSVNSEVAK